MGTATSAGGLFIGIDLGTSAAKLLLVDEAGQVLCSVNEPYPLSFPHPGWSEQDPLDWWNAVRDGIPRLISGYDAARVRGIGCAGQMHGLVILDKNGAVIRPAILWNDGRTAEEVDFLNTVVGRQQLSAWTANIAFAGFTAPKLLWLQKHEPAHFRRIERIMLPKDYVNYRLTGAHCTDYSDASGMLLLDVARKDWSAEMLALCGVTRTQLPHLHESWEPIGTLLPELAEELGLPAGTVVVAGAGDNAAAAIGTGTVSGGDCNISLGTSGTIFIASDICRVDENNALHTFAHATGGYHLMGCMLSAASCSKWFCEQILGTNDYGAAQADIDDGRLGNDQVYFLPYLMGERSPINDTNARGAFIGMRMDTSRADLVQAVLEGVAFAIRDSMEVAKALGRDIRSSTLCGGGAKSPLWRRILANVLDMDLALPQSEEGPGLGGAMLAMVGCGVDKSPAECARRVVKIRETIHPDPAIASRYARQYRKYQMLYPALKEIFPKI